LAKSEFSNKSLVPEIFLGLALCSSGELCSTDPA